MWFLLICILSSDLIINLECAIKSFKYDVDIYSSNHWVGGNPQKVCEGLIFPELIPIIVPIRKLEVKEIVLPSTSGGLYLEDDFEIVFDENTKSPMNCVELKDIGAHEWSEPSVWEISNEKNNVAIPHAERLPCEYDDVIFPHGIKTGTIVHFSGSQVKMRSLRFGNEQWTNEDLLFYSDSPVMSEVFVTFGLMDTFDITNKSCEDPGGCICGNEYVGRCQEVPQVQSINCLHPVRPIGFCTDICGASILAEPDQKFKIAEIEKILQIYDSDTYVSKVKGSAGKEVIQIIFSEKEFTGDSLDEANSFHQQISNDPSFHLKQPHLYASGTYYEEGAMTKNTVGVVFGTLLGVCLVFVAVFLVYSPDGRAENLRNRIVKLRYFPRLNFGPRRMSNFTSRFFARYDSVGDDAGLIFEGRSMAGSVVSLEKAFENPLYGKEKEVITPSTSTTSDDINLSSDKGSRSDGDTDNNLFVIKENNEEIENLSDEDGELVDLTDVER
nr:protein amnionless [Leptinotarsa decemlineata]